VDQFDPDTMFTDFGTFHVAKNQWFGQHFEGIRATAMAYGPPGEPIWFIGDRGEIWSQLQGKITKAQLPDSGLDGRGLGQPNDIRCIAGKMYICGFAGQVYTLDRGKWVHIDDGLAEPTGKPDSIDLVSIDGTGPDDIYVVGSGGLVAHFDGRKWTRIPVLTNLHLSKVRCTARNKIFAVGHKGVFMESDSRAWKVERIPGAEEKTLSDVTVYKDKLYLAGVEDLFVRTAKGWEIVRHGLPKEKTTFLKLEVGDDRLWALGFKRLNSFDGKKWIAHPDPNNG